MSAPVDVLQVMREASVVLDQDDRSDTNEKLLAAVDAVAELIKAAKNVVDAADPKHVGSVEYRLMEALARVGGAS